MMTISKAMLIWVSLTLVSACDSTTTLLPTTVLVERDSLKILAHDGFPKVMDCNIYLGNLLIPLVDASGKDGMVDDARINVDIDSSVGMILRDRERELRGIMLFFHDFEGKAVALFDLNIDGIWDIKKTPTRVPANFIWFRGDWLEVNEISGITSSKTKASSNIRQFEFIEQGWRE